MSYGVKKLTPNLVVSSVEQSLAFYCDVLGFTKTDTVPDQSPYVYAIVKSGPVEVFFNAIARHSKSTRWSPASPSAAR